MVQIRPATLDDVPAIVDIYNASILTMTTWSEMDQTVVQRTDWLAARHAAGDGVLVAIEDMVVVGFAGYGDHRDTVLWPGYRFTVEHSVHVRDGWHGRGIGRSLLSRLVEHATAHGKHVMIAAVDAENAGSIAFHDALGFVEVGRLHEVGWKFDRWLDLVLLQLTLGDGAS